MKRRKIIAAVSFCFVIVLFCGFFFPFVKRNYYGRSPLAVALQLLPFPSTFIGPPKGYVSAKEAVALDYRMLWPATQVSYPPFPFGEFYATSPYVSGAKEFPETFVLTLENARVLGSTGIIITSQDRVLADTAIDWIPSIEHHRVFRKIKLPKVTYLDGTLAVIASKSADCYYHWMVDILPRFELLKRSGVHFDKIYLNALTHPFQKETVERICKQLNLSKKDIIWAEPHTHLAASKVIAISLPSGPSWVATARADPLWVSDYLKRTFLSALPNPPAARRLYISRADAPTRRILNESQLMAALAKRGFEEVKLTQLSVAEQAALFASAECIVAFHGAGLTNLVFCKEGTHVVEIFSPHYLNPCYWNLSHALQLRHSCLIGNQNGLTALQQKNNDIQVDVETVLQQLQPRV